MTGADEATGPTFAHLTQAEALDRAHILRPFLRHCWGATYGPELGREHAARLVETLATEDVGGILAALESTVVLAMEQDRPVGMIAGALRSGTLYLWGLYVDPERQRRGTGRALIDRMRTSWPHATAAVTVLCASTGAIAFYEALGFAAAGDVSTYELASGLALPCVTMRTRDQGGSGRTS